jgi:hypothetical protein
MGTDTSNLWLRNPPYNAADVGLLTAKFNQLDKLLEAGFINVKGFYNGGAWLACGGIGGNGDDAIIQAAAAKAGAAGGVIYFPPGKYKISTSIPLTNLSVIAAPNARFVHGADIDLVLPGPRGSWDGGYFDLNSGSFTKSVFKFDTALWPVQGAPYGDYDTYVRDASRIRNVTARSVNAQGKFIHMYGASGYLTGVNATDLRAYGFGEAVLVDATGGSPYIHSCYFSNLNAFACACAIHLKGGDVSGFRFEGILTQGGSTYTAGIFLENASANFFNDCFFWDMHLAPVNAYSVHISGTSTDNIISGVSVDYRILDESTGDNTIGGLSGKLWSGADLIKTRTYPYTDGPGTVVGNTATLTAGAYVTKSFNCKNAQKGDFFLVSPPFSMQGCLAQAYAIADNVVELLVYNGTGVDKSFTIGPSLQYWKFKRFPFQKCSNYFNNIWVSNIPAGGVISHDFTVPGTEIGDFTLAAFRPANTGGANMSGVLITSAVTAADTVTVWLKNLTGNAIDMSIGSVTHPAWFIKFWKATKRTTTFGWDPGDVVNGAGVNGTFTFENFGQSKCYAIVAPVINPAGLQIAINKVSVSSWEIDIRLQNFTGSMVNIDTVGASTTQWHMMIIDEDDVL